MAHGVEVVLGFAPDAYPVVGKALKIKLPALGDADAWEAVREGGVEEWLDEHGRKKLTVSLIEAHVELLKLLGFQDISEPKKKGLVEAINATTPLGARAFSPLRFELFYDWNEMGEEPEHTTFGVALSGRYFPTLLDWRDPSGGLWPVRLDAETTGVIASARAILAERWPVFEQAHVTIVERHY